MLALHAYLPAIRSYAFRVLLVLTFAFTIAPSWAEHVVIFLPPQLATSTFAAEEIESALKKRGHTSTRSPLNTFASSRAAHAIIITEAGDRRTLGPIGIEALDTIEEEGFSLRREKTDSSEVVWIIGKGAGGAMYGGLEVAEQIRLKDLDAVQNMDVSPHMPMRGTKFNIPLDVRTPSYSDMSDAAQANIEEMWNFDFWSGYLDTLARHRYNYVSLWNLHPFPSLVKVPDYPDVALTDVKRSTIEFDEDYPTIATELVTPKMVQRSETVRKMTIEEKIEFWRRVMEYAKGRNIDFYIITWNIFTYGVDGKYGITDAIDNTVTVDYFRKSVRELFRTYPLLKGVGLTTGENMGEVDFQAKEDWAFATYGEGVLDAARAEPDREMKLIHRQHQTRAQDIARTFAPLVKQPNVDFIFSFKYAQAHALSSTKQTFHHGYIESLGDLKTLWTLRNDDALMFRWGAPDFVREFITNIPHEPSQGYYFGSDMWVWGREFLSREARPQRPLEIDKHWYQWMLWGRLGYDPRLDNTRIVALLADRFPDASAESLFRAWQDASMIYPLTTGFHWADFDFQWYIEGCRSRPGPAQTQSGFHDVNRFITLGTHPGTDNIAIPRYVEAFAAQEELKGTTPIEVAAQIDDRADAALEKLGALRKSATHRPSKTHPSELSDTLHDIEAMALLGKYYASKIRGATELALYRRIGEAKYRERAIEQLSRAEVFWRQYTALAASMYKNPLWTNRVGIVDWHELNAEVAKDVQIAREARAPSQH